MYVHIVPKDLSGYDYDKYYVGITSRKVSERWKNGSGYKNNVHFYRAIERYGWENLCHEIVAECLTKKEACEFEKALIKTLNSNDYLYGYNISSGGESNLGLYGEKNPNYGHKWNDEQRKHLSDIRKGIKLSEEHKKKISKRSKEMWQSETFRNKMTGENHPCYGRTGTLHPMYGKHGSEIANSKKVICLNTLEIFDSARDASKIKNVNHSKLCMCCRGERNSCGKDNNGDCLTWMFYDDYLLMNKDNINEKIIMANDDIYKHKNSYKPIVNVEQNQLYSSIINATKVNNLKSNARIGQACKNRNETAYKHHWMYYDDYLKENNLSNEEARMRLFFVV